MGGSGFKNNDAKVAKKARVMKERMFCLRSAKAILYMETAHLVLWPIYKFFFVAFAFFATFA
jgi:hypothetical protein